MKTPKDIGFHQFVQRVNKAVEEIKRDDLLDLGEHPGKTLCELCEKNRMTLEELMELIRLGDNN